MTVFRWIAPLLGVVLVGGSALAVTGTAAAAKAGQEPCQRSEHRMTNGYPAFRDCPTTPEMVLLRGGTFSMGDTTGNGQPYERPVHEVKLGPFAFGRYEVTYGEWQACVKAGACTEPTIEAAPGHARYPVVGVSWTMAQTYVNWLAAKTGKPYRLPSEAEWEYAARAGSDGLYYWGSFDPDPCRHANLLDQSGLRAHPAWHWAESCDDHFAEAAPVGSFPANPWGFHDVLGNVWEWVADCWHADYTGAPANGAAWMGGSCSKHVDRGGGWGNNLRAMRLSSRDADPAAAHSDGLGFRVARGVLPGELPEGPRPTPDSVPTATQFITLAKPRGYAATVPVAQPAGPQSLTAADLPPPATSLALERELILHVALNGKQTWKNGLQHYDASTVQDYRVQTHLRSDGTLYADNLLDPDLEKRLKIKHDFLARRGLIHLKATHNGRLPQTAEEIEAISQQVQSLTNICVHGQNCASDIAETLAALDALRNNSTSDLEQLIAAPATGTAARWLYFFGYSGCPNQIQLSYQAHTVGERAYDRSHKDLVPWSLDRSANTQGTADEQAHLCDHYVVTVDTQTGDIYLETMFLPSPIGETVRRIDRQVEHRSEELPIDYEVLNWATAALSKTRETLQLSATLDANAPFDEDRTVLGVITGKVNATLDWSFKPVPGAPVAQVPLPPPPIP